MNKLFVLLYWLVVPCAFAASTVDSKLVEKLNAYVSECGAPGAEPKPKMAELVTYLQGHGFKDVKLECGISNYGVNAPMMMLHLADGGEVFVNYKRGKNGAKVSEIIEDSKTPEGLKRHVIWPTKKAKTK